MSLSKDLFDLIKAMDKAEKRYFKLFAQTNKTGSNYLRLFDAINKQNVYDEDTLKRKFRKENFVKQLSVTKYKLYKLILKSLRAYRHSGEIEDMLQDVRILFKKKLFVQCHKILDRCEKIVQQQELHHPSLEIYRIRTHILLEEGEQVQLMEKLEYLNKQLNNSLHKLLEVNQYSLKVAQINFYIRRLNDSEEKQKALEELMSSPEMREEDRASTFESKKMFYFIQTLYGQYIGDLQRVYAYSKKRVELYEQFPDIIQNSPLVYIASLHNYLIACQLLKKYNHFRTSLLKMRSIKSNEVLIQMKTYLQSWYWELVLHIATLNLFAAHQAAQELEKGLKKYAGNINHDMEWSFFQQLTFFYLKIGESETALGWVLKILEHPHKQKNLAIYRFASILELLIHFDLQNDWLLTSKARSVYRSLYKQAPIQAFEQSVLYFLRRAYPKAANKRELNTILRKWQSELKEIQSKEMQKGYFDAFDFCYWIEAKLNGKTYWKLLEDKNTSS